MLFCVLGLAQGAGGQTAQLLRDSLERLNTELRVSPENADLRLKKAAVNIELGQWDYAIEEYGRVLDRDADNLAALFYRAYAYTNTQQLGFARRDYEHFLRLVPEHFKARVGLAYVKERMGRKTDAMDELNRLVQMHPDSAQAYAARASFETSCQQFDVALYDWQEAMRLAPDNKEYVVSCADVLIRLDKKREARRLLLDAVRRGLATRGELHEWLARCQ